MAYWVFPCAAFAASVAIGFCIVVVVTIAYGVWVVRLL